MLTHPSLQKTQLFAALKIEAPQVLLETLRKTPRDLGRSATSRWEEKRAFQRWHQHSCCCEAPKNGSCLTCVAGFQGRCVAFLGVFGQCSGAVFGWGWFIPTLQMMRWWHYDVCAFFNQHPVQKEPKLLWFHVGLSRSKRPKVGIPKLAKETIDPELNPPKFAELRPSKPYRGHHPDRLLGSFQG